MQEPATVPVFVLFTLKQSNQHATKRHHPFFKKSKKEQQ